MCKPGLLAVFDQSNGCKTPKVGGEGGGGGELKKEKLEKKREKKRGKS